LNMKKPLCQRLEDMKTYHLAVRHETATSGALTRARRFLSNSATQLSPSRHNKKSTGLGNKSPKKLAQKPARAAGSKYRLEPPFCNEIASIFSRNHNNIMLPSSHLKEFREITAKSRRILQYIYNFSNRSVKRIKVCTHCS